MGEVVRKLKVRSGTAAAWTAANPTLSAGEIGYETDTNKFKIGDGSTEWNDIADYFETGTASGEPVITAGTISQYWRGDKTFQTLNKSAVGLPNVDNTADSAKPISTAQQTALDLKAPLASPGLTGTPTAPTQSAGNNTTRLATTAFVQGELINKIVLAEDSPETILSIWSGSQAQYDAIPSPDELVLYIIV
jgi:hypothetical protein